MGERRLACREPDLSLAYPRKPSSVFEHVLCVVARCQDDPRRCGAHDEVHALSDTHREALEDVSLSVLDMDELCRTRNHRLDGQGLGEPALGLQVRFLATLLRRALALLRRTYPRVEGQQAQRLAAAVGSHAEAHVRVEALLRAVHDAKPFTLALEAEAGGVVKGQAAARSCSTSNRILEVSTDDGRQIHSRVGEKPVGRLQLRGVAEGLGQAQLRIPIQLRRQPHGAIDQTEIRKLAALELLMNRRKRTHEPMEITRGRPL